MTPHLRIWGSRLPTPMIVAYASISSSSFPLSVYFSQSLFLIGRAHSFRSKFDKCRGILVNSAADRGKADEIPRLTAVHS